jgi:hypothetical protein
VAVPIKPLSGNVARALRFYNEPEVCVGIAVSTAWPTDSAPPDPIASNRALGWITAEVYTGTSLSATNCVARLAGQTTPYVGNLSYRVAALSATTYEVRRVDNNALMGTTPLTTSATPLTTVIPGLALTVTGSALVAGDTYVFHADGVLGFKVCDQKSLVVPDAAGTIVYNGQNWRVVAPANALAEGAYQVYVHAALNYAELPVGITYRQVGVLTGVTRAAGTGPSVLALTPDLVSSNGFVELVDNKPPQTRSNSQRENYAYILVF